MAKKCRNRQRQIVGSARTRKKRQDKRKKLVASNQVPYQQDIEDKVDYALEIAEKGNLQKGAHIFAKLEEQHGNHPHICFGRGVLAVIGGRHDEAIPLFKQATQLSPGFVEAHYNLAVAYQKQLRVSQMIVAYRNVVRIGEAHSDMVQKAHTILKTLAQQIRKSEGISLDDYLKAYQIFDRGVEHMESREWKDAIADFKESLSINPNRTQAHGNLGICYAKTAQKQIALEALDKALELDPNYEPAQANRKLIASLEEGKPLDTEVTTINYYRETHHKKKSVIKKLADSLGFNR
ncbi:MAG: tetratricopeptide repeat protein [Planctomycetes bacterium]|nr:tetratricopeptide repeat protein [Planctomycetota bacterium]